MKKTWLIIISLIILSLIVYLNRSYAHIYAKIEAIGLRSPDQQHLYLIGNNMTSTKQIIYAALGDSLTAGVGAAAYEQSFPYLLAQKLATSGTAMRLIDLAVPGAKSEDVIASQLDQAIASRPDIITILIGINDIHGLVAAAKFQNNYERILNRLDRETQAEIYAIAIPYLGSATLLLPPYNIYYDVQTGDFNAVIKNLGSQYRFHYIDLYTPTVKIFKHNGPHYSADLFHPSAEGYAWWAQLIYDDINR